MESVNWRDSIVNQLQTRNKEQVSQYEDVILAHTRLFEVYSSLRQENEKLRAERIASNGSSNRASGGGVGNSGSSSSDARISQLEAKLLTQQEELTELHKKRGENAELLIDLNKRLQEKTDQLAATQSKLDDSLAVISNLKIEIQRLATSKTELENINQLIRDEHTALQLAYSHAEVKLRKCQKENTELVDRLMKYKSKDAEKLNEENDNFLRKKYATIQKELEEAAEDSTRLNPLQNFVDDIPFSDKSAVPTTASCVFDAHEGEISAIKWSPVDKLLATAGTDRKVKLWDTSKCSSVENRGMLVGSNAGILSISFDTTGSFILGASHDFATRVWGVNDQRLKHTLTGHCRKVLAAKFLGEPTRVATGSHDCTLKIWDLRSKACIETKFVGSSCNDLVTSDASGTTIISGHFDKKIRMWDTRTDAIINEIQVQDKVTSLDLRRDGNTLLCCARDDTLQILDLRTNQVISTYSHNGFRVACDWTRSVFSPQGDFVAVGSNDGNVYVWNTNTEQNPTILRHHTAPVIAVSWHPFANLIASSDRQKRAIIWADI